MTGFLWNPEAGAEPERLGSVFGPARISEGLYDKMGPNRDTENQVSRIFSVIHAEIASTALVRAKHFVTHGINANRANSCAMGKYFQSF
ncbi:hypothetical protein [Desulfomonile tiedjei]|uniref:Uncharacterized protein n=1 Tax=Desulfomonile tiedjei (strain ATCC 49306 / DSM 6799 / DCB-1) TaxID=706587 RepID=I4CDY9_DESTA|nr:hypothetical protein [Desulfomonile tiedjei]AFM27780.1 hypothetical protein Desti_5178 [Desulfomonile tiedjei DSM 6799]